MRRIAGWLLLASLSAGLAAGQPGRGGMRGGMPGGGQAPLTNAPIVEFKGAVSKVQISPGEGMPFVEIKTPQQVAKIFLGPVPYLMAQGFNPKVNEEITARAYKLETGFVAIAITLPGQKKTFVLRDKDGSPKWRGGMPGRGRK